MYMDIKDLLFFNKEGHAINAQYNDDLKLWHSKILIDKNSVDTFKTQALYLFEKINGTTNTFNAQLNKFQLFNTNDFYIQPSDKAILNITDIKNVNTSGTYNTKWVYAQDIEKHFENGSWCYFTNLNGYHFTDFNEFISNELNAFKILHVQVGRILIYTNTNNTFNVNATIPINAQIHGINVIECHNLNIEPIWNETNINNKLYKNKKLSLITGSDNDDIYSIFEVAIPKTRNVYTLLPNIYTPVAGDSLSIELQLNTSNIIISKGQIQFNTNELTVPYIPNYLNIGDQIYAQANTGSLLLGNDNILIVTDIDYTTNIITVNQTLSTQIIDSTLFLNSNVFKMLQQIPVDNNNTYSLTLAYWTILNEFQDELLSIAGGYTMQYDEDTDILQLISDYTNNYSTINVEIIQSNNNIINLNANIITDTNPIIPIVVNQQLNNQIKINRDANIYNRSITFNTIDNFGLNININGIDYNIPYDITVNDTINDWLNQYQLPLQNLGINVSQIGLDTIDIQSQYPNVSVFTQLNMGDFSDYIVRYKSIQFSNIKTQLLITINEQQFSVIFDTDDDTTVNNWVNTYAQQLSLQGIIVTNMLNVINFDLLDPERQLDITYNIGYIPKNGDTSVYETLYSTNNTSSIIVGNEINIPGTNLLDFYSTGQKISIIGSDWKLQNKSYNIIALSNDTLQLSYQGAYWDFGFTDITITSDYFIRYPKYGFTHINNSSHIKFTWKDTQTPDLFLYDFSGTQLKPYTNEFPNYNGPTPLCGVNGEFELKLNKKPNKDINQISNPLKQQTIFDKLQYDLPYLDSVDNPNIEPSPLQVFVGYNSQYETWNKARLYVELIEDLTFDLDTAFNNDNLFIFKDNYVELQNSIGINFLHLGFKQDQVITFKSTDISDNKKLVTLDNDGIKYRITSVQPTRIYFNKNVVEENSIKSIATDTAPFYNVNTGEPIMINRILNVKLIVQPRVISYFDIFAESEGEDERYKININNRNKNLLKLQDFFIFKQVDIKEQGVDWIFMNRKRKELLEIYPELTNYLGSYKSVIKAIDFFGYNDLIFGEYYQNINPTSEKFGKLFNVQLLNIFDKSSKGWTFDNLSTENLRNVGYRKTNLFSLNYMITDNNGNFVNAYSLDEVKVKLLGLKKWLTDNIIPIGTKIIDINGAYKNQDNYVINHETYMSKNFNVEEYADPIDFDVTAYNNGNNNNYDISVQFKSYGQIEWFEYRIRTFYLDTWDDTVSYLANTKLIFDNQIWVNIEQTFKNEQPGLSPKWVTSSIDQLSCVQILRDFKSNTNPNTSFTIDENIDPHFQIEVSWHSGYALSHKTVKSYSLLPNIFNDLIN